MKRSIAGIMAMYGLAVLSSEREIKGKQEGEEPYQPEFRRKPSPYKGMKPFVINGVTIWALNEKNAERKYNNIIKSKDK